MKKNHFKTFSLHRKPNLEQKQFNRTELQKFLRSNTKLMLLPKKLFTNKGERKTFIDIPNFVWYSAVSKVFKIENASHAMSRYIIIRYCLFAVNSNSRFAFH